MAAVLRSDCKVGATGASQFFRWPLASPASGGDPAIGVDREAARIAS